MPDVRIDVVRTRGHCNADFHEGETFFYNGSQLIGTDRGYNCLFAQGTIVTNLGRLTLMKCPLYLSCPDPGMGEGGSVTFRISFMSALEGSTLKE
ncbi:MAG: hypothetical protein AMJ88_06305 [Anaerolineae bacterium SM23_ 63]|nr:MAG: hypothetical protein AMJ88_06305 [Anaerolineae bacterium SM23_ 63]HEY47520.1 TIGR04076 family protein [Anaerolineae bacterium]